MNNILSIDYGERYLGLAVRTDKTTIPIPITVIDSKKQNVLKAINGYIENYNISTIVIGYPIGLNNSENRMTNLVNSFVEELLNLNVQVHKIDEIGINGDFVESQAFAYLAIRSFLKLPISFPETTGCIKPTTGGKIIKFK